ncbi:class I SAM-dependent methyltransferase [Thiolinea disciformis]|uniref:class I SAM-dependent methyltransferase n=1 Tax=Thiolinea disciformis TaxID=125614 RepID=UPI000367F495|nr:class I SAM-dependent methyltransferase [Thiolinea disciformis]
MKEKPKSQALTLKAFNLNNLPSLLKVADSPHDLKRVKAFREKIFRPLYPHLTNADHDQHDYAAVHLFTEDIQGNIVSSARLVFDSEYDLPADTYAKTWLDNQRQLGAKLMEVSRFAIDDDDRQISLLRIYHRAFYEIARANHIEKIMIVINKKSLKFYANRVGAKMVLNSINAIAGSEFEFSCMEWNTKLTKSSFIQWIKGEEKLLASKKLPKKAGKYSIRQWNQYSRFFASVYTHVQRELYHEAVSYLTGHVVDLGAGPARIAPLLADKPDVTAYTGIEYAAEMVEIARFTLQNINKPSFEVLHQAIEETEGLFDSAVSLQSFYAWTSPLNTLNYIYELLKPGALLVLATPNRHFNQAKLFHDAEKELMWHPDFEAFKAYNFQLAANPSANFVAMNELLDFLRNAGFDIQSCHSKHYQGMVNFVIAQKM